ncbi:uncharacterized protein [Gossypium hirsutum]|uniref:GAG-pre-integrase domain-containing protein n=1 Tax=Gossypium hirsutum TaxID=3635 RepID=A0ABM3A9P7_GOSHI|nr:uncharacterized protein LOC121218440 [Gossypium hirsutum]
MSCIQNSVSDVIFTRIMACESPKQAWDKLKEEFQWTERTRQQQLLNLRREFENFKMKEEETFNEARIVEKVISTFHERYEAKISSLKDSRNLSSIYLTELINALYAQEQRRASRLEEHQEGAFQARTNTAYKGKKVWKDKPMYDAARKEGQTYRLCKTASYSEEKCWFRPDALCQQCKKKGHVERVCKSKGKPRQSHSQQMKAEARVTKEDSDQEEQVFVVSCSAVQQRISSGWLLYNGCTNHMTPDAAIFKNLLSIAQLLEKGYSIVFKHNQCQISDPSGSKLMAVSMADKNFVVDWTKESDTAYIATTDESKLWHQRLGHANFKSTEHMCKSGLAENFISSKPGSM